MEVKEGFMPFMGYQTYYRIVGTTEEGKSPIILLHGGPGSTHNYFELLDRVAETGRAVIMYDQLWLWTILRGRSSRTMDSRDMAQ